MEGWNARRKTRRQARMEEILQTALGLLSKHGLEGFRLDALAQAMGFSTAALYKYVPSRDALVVAVQQRALVELHETLAASIAEYPAACKKARVPVRVRALSSLVLLAHDYGSLGARLPQHMALISASMASPEPVIASEEAKKLAAILGATLALIEAPLTQAVMDGELRDGCARRRAGAFFSAVHGTAQALKLSRIQPASFSARSVVDVAAALLAGMGASEASLKLARRVLPKPERAGAL